MSLNFKSYQINLQKKAKKDLEKIVLWSKLRMAGETWPRFCVSGTDGDETSDVENATRLLGGVLLKGNIFLHEDIVE
jgi:hypothetical protein